MKKFAAIFLRSSYSPVDFVYFINNSVNNRRLFKNSSISYLSISLGFLQRFNRFKNNCNVADVADCPYDPLGWYVFCAPSRVDQHGLLQPNGFDHLSRKVCVTRIGQWDICCVKDEAVIMALVSSTLRDNSKHGTL